MKVSAQYAEDHFKEILATAERGEEVEIASEGSPRFKLHLVSASEAPTQTGQRILGAGRGEIVLGAGRGELALPTDDEWRAMKEEDARLWDDASLMTSGEI